MDSAPYVATEEMTNIHRVLRLLMGPCTYQLRDLLRFYIPPARFPSVIQRERNRLPRLTKVQRELILPNSGMYSGNYDDMDISLLYILLRNVCGIKAHNRGWNNIPDSADRSESANIERLHLARNECFHFTGLGMSSTIFNQYWSNIKASVVDLDKVLLIGNTYSKEVDIIQTDSMDPVRDKQYIDQLLQQMKDIENVQIEVESLKSAQEGIQERMLCMDNRNIPPNIKDQIKEQLESWKMEDEPFHEIHSFLNILKKVKSQAITTIIGGPGSGKTAMARHLALRLQKDEEFEIVPVEKISKIIEYGQLTCKQLFIHDDVTGICSVEYKNLTTLDRYKEQILKVLGEDSKILFTCRLEEYNEAYNYKSYVLKEELIVDLQDNNNRLDDEDRSQILKNHSILNGISLRPDEQPNYASTEGTMMYPLLCKLFCSEPKYRASGKEFFEKPIICITEQLEKMQNLKPLHYASLVLCLFYQNDIENILSKNDTECMKLRDKVLDNCEANGRNTQILHALKNMLNTFTVHSNNGYSLIHDSVYEVVAFHYGNKNQVHMIQDMNSRFVAKKVCISDTSTSDEPKDLRIKIKREHFPALAERLVRDLRDLKLHDVFMNKTLRIKCICDAFIDELKKMSFIKIKELFFETKAKREKFLNYVFESEDGVFEWDRQSLLIKDTTLNYNIRAISWVISYGHSQLLMFLFDHVTEHDESIRRVMDLEIPAKSGYKSNLNEQCRFLTLSCYSGDVDVVKLSLKHCDAECINGSFNSKCTPPLVAACRVGNMTVVKELIRHGASINVQGDRSSPIYEASSYGHVNVVDFLIECGANCIRGDKHGITPLYGASKGGHVDVVELLIKHGAKCNQRYIQGRIPINEASKAGHINVVKLLIKHGADYNQRDGLYRTPIHAAAEAGHVDIAELLIKCGVDYNERDGYGRTPIHNASNIGNVDVVDLLIKHDADCNLRDSFDRTPIHEASKNGHDAVVDLLVKCGADCNQSDENGRTPLHEASTAPSFRAKSLQYMTIVRALIESGANIDQKDNNGESPLSVALKTNHQTIAKILLEHGAKSIPTE